jgi:phage tail sheath protein FI
VTTILLQESALVRATGVGATRPDASATLPDPGQHIWDTNTLPTNVAVSGPDLASDGQSLEEATFTAGPPGTGLSALDETDILNLLVMPPNNDDGTLDVGIVTAAATYCEQRRAMLLLDSPPDWVTASDVEAAFIDGFDIRIGTRSPNAAIFFPRVRQPNPLHNNLTDTFGAAGAIAGVMARTDARRGVWKAPAGLEANLIGIADLDVTLTADAIGLLSRMGVNCLRAVPGVGRVIWGARTLRGLDRPVSEWRYIPVRRTALFIEESILRGTQWASFEPNDAQLWARIEAQVEAFLRDLFRQGAFQGTKPSEAYFVRCDRSTTTHGDVARGTVIISVGFAPLKPAEFVILRLSVTAGQT